VIVGKTAVLVHNCGGPTETDAKLARGRAEDLQSQRDDYPNAANHGTTSVIGVFNKTTQKWTNHVSINGDGAMPSGWKLGEGENSSRAPVMLRRQFLKISAQMRGLGSGERHETFVAIPAILS
jgi:hypothetical protein